MIADTRNLGQFFGRNPFPRAICCLSIVLMMAGASRAVAQGSVAVELSISAPSPQPVGTPVTLQATISGATFPASYQFSVRPVGGDWQIVRDFNLYNLFEWSTLDEGWYEIRVVAGSAVDLALAEDRLFYLITTRAIFGIPAVNPTSHPLVALTAPRPA